MSPKLRPGRPRLALVVPLVALGGMMATAKEPDRPRPLEVHVDASEVARRLLHTRLVIPAAPGPLTLVYPKWIPGTHAPTGPIADVAGLRITAGGRRIAWQRDDVDMYSFHCEVPAGVDALEVAFDFLATTAKVEAAGAETVTVSPRLAIVNWNEVVLYPKGRPARAIECVASLNLPAGWQLGTALRTASRSAARTTFQPVSLETLVDSPVLCGAHFRTVPLASDTKLTHTIEIACDGDDGLKLEPKVKKCYERLIAEAGACLGARHYESYHFLVALSDHFGVGTAIEHHESSDNRLPERMFVDDKVSRYLNFLLPHEYVHSWNGKNRRPADMVVDDFQQPLRTRLLWVYEGLTQYLSTILTARSGLWTVEEFREFVAYFAEEQRNQRGRSWRSLEDTAVSAQLLYSARDEWSAWRRSVDFYDEGLLIWLEVDTIIRQETKGARSLDDVCRRFFGGTDGPPSVKSFVLDDLLAELNAIAPYDWKRFFREYVSTVGADLPLDGFRRAGWRLTYADTPSSVQQSVEHVFKVADLGSSIGLTVNEDNSIEDIIPGKPADRAGIAPGMKLIAVNSRRFSTQGLRAAVAATKDSKSPLELLLEDGEFFKTFALDYHDGEKYPRLERDPEREDLLTPILKPLSPRSQTGSRAKPRSSPVADAEETTGEER